MLSSAQAVEVLISEFVYCPHYSFSSASNKDLANCCRYQIKLIGTLIERVVSSLLVSASPTNTEHPTHPNWEKEGR